MRLYSVFLLPCVLALAACQTTIKPDYDTSYDFSTSQTWQWAEPKVTFTPADDPRLSSDLTAERVKQAVADGLDARGLRPVLEGQTADLSVKTYVVVENREENVSTSFGGYWGWGGGFWGGPSIQTYPSDYKEITLQIDLLDPASGRLLWRGSESERLSSSPQTPAKRDEQARRMTSRVLEAFPPY